MKGIDDLLVESFQVELVLRVIRIPISQGSAEVQFTFFVRLSKFRVLRHIVVILIKLVLSSGEQRSLFHCELFVFGQDIAELFHPFELLYILVILVLLDRVESLLSISQLVDLLLIEWLAEKCVRDDLHIFAEFLLMITFIELRVLRLLLILPRRGN